MQRSYKGKKLGFKSRKVSFDKTENEPFQGSLFSELENTKPLKYFPKIVREHHELVQMVIDIPNNSYVGIDFEFGRNYMPTEVGIAYGNKAFGSRWSSGFVRLIERLRVEKGCKLVAFATIEADKEVYERVLGGTTPLSSWEDAMILHYLCNNNLTQGTGQKDNSVESLGLMNLWTATSLIHPIPNWKYCWGSKCNGHICPVHDRQGYCATDAWAGLQVFLANQRILEKFGFDWKIYRETLELQEYFLQMSRRGIKVNRERVRQLESEADSKKFALFGANDLARAVPFNPSSPVQILEYFSNFKDIKLNSTDINDVGNCLNGFNEDYGMEKLTDWLGITPDQENELPDEIFWLRRTYANKLLGKGLSAWFDPKYIDNEGFAHPRFNTTNCSTPRISSSDPNYTNLPRLGFGSEVRDALTVRSDDLLFIKSDYSSGELRKVGWSSGLDLGMGSPWPKFLANPTLASVCAAIAREKEKTESKDVLKSFVYGDMYGEGLTLIEPSKMKSTRTKNMIFEGSLLVYPDWTYRDQIVGFTGVNLAQRLFKSKDNKARAKALNLMRIYNQEVPNVVTWQRKITRFIEEHGYINSITGRFMWLYADDKRNIKRALSYNGQGEFADFVTETLLTIARECKREQFWPVLMIHDEFDFEAVRGSSFNRSLKIQKEIMEAAKNRLPGFACPTESKYGKTLWSERMVKWDGKSEVDV